MLLCKIFLRKIIHKVSDIISFDYHYCYSDTQQHSMCKFGNAQKRKMHVQLERFHLQCFQISWSMFHLKKTPENFSIIMRHVTTEKGAKCILCYKTVLIDDKKKSFFTKMFTNPRFLLANVAVHDETN